MATEVLLARHAEAVHMLTPDIVAGRAPQSEITKNGIAQAVRLGSLLPEFAPTIAHSSPLERARRTSTLALRAAKIGLEPRTNPDLQEQCLGDKEGRPRELAYTDEVKAQLRVQGVDYQHPGYNRADEQGESLRQVIDRMLHYLSSLRAETVPEQRVFAVSHHLAIKGLVASLAMGGLEGKVDPIELRHAIREAPPIEPCARSLFVVEGQPDALRIRMEYVGVTI